MVRSRWIWKWLAWGCCDLQPEVLFLCQGHQRGWISLAFTCGTNFGLFDFFKLPLFSLRLTDIDSGKFEDALPDDFYGKIVAGEGWTINSLFISLTPLSLVITSGGRDVVLKANEGINSRQPVAQFVVGVHEVETDDSAERFNFFERLVFGHSWIEISDPDCRSMCWRWRRLCTWQSSGHHLISLQNPLCYLFNLITRGPIESISGWTSGTQSRLNRLLGLWIVSLQNDTDKDVN